MRKSRKRMKEEIIYDRKGEVRKAGEIMKRE